MYCHNCGTKLNNNEQFCGNCGTKIENENLNFKPMKNNLSFLSDNSTTGNLLKMYLMLLCAQVFKLILWFVDTFTMKVTVEQLNYTYDRTHSLYESYSDLNIIAIPLSVISILICAFVIYRKCFEKRVFGIVLRSVALLSCANYIFLLFMSIYDYINNTKNLNNVYGEGMAEIYSGPTFWGIILLIAIIGSTILAFKISSKTKNIKSNV